MTEATEVVASTRELLLGEIAIDINDIFNVSFFFLRGFLFFNGFSTYLTATSFSGLEHCERGANWFDLVDIFLRYTYI